MRLYAFKDEYAEHTFSVSLIVIGWLCLSASLCAQPLSFMAPEEAAAGGQQTLAGESVLVAYHDVEDDAADQRYLSVRTSALNEQISWLLHNGYHAVSVQDILDAHEGKALPPKAVLLSFDDGYSSFTPGLALLQAGTFLRCGHRWAAGWIRRQIKS